MAGKALAFGSRRLGYALDAMSKNALIDLVIDRAKLETGHPDDATDEEIAEVVQGWMGPVFQARGDRPVSFAGMMARLDKNDADYVAKTGKYTPVSPERQAALDAEFNVARKVMEMTPEERTKGQNWTDRS